MNFFSVGSLEGVTVLRVQAAPAWDLHGIMSPASKSTPALVPVYIHMSIQESVPAQASHWTTSSYGHPSVLAWGPPWAASASPP